MSFGMILKNKRIECGMLQEDVAKRMGLSQKTISSWELDRTVPKLDDYAKLSVIFNSNKSEKTAQPCMFCGFLHKNTPEKSKNRMPYLCGLWDGLQKNAR